MAKFLSYRTTTHDEEYVNLEDIAAIVACEGEGDAGAQSEIWLRSDPDNCLEAVGTPAAILRGSVREV